MTARPASVFLAALALAACSESAVTTATPVNREQDELVRFFHLPNLPTIFTIASYPARHVVRSRAELEAVWWQLWVQREGSTSVPPIDFTREMVIAVTMGERGTGGYTIQVDSVYRRNGGYEVVVLSMSPKGYCLVHDTSTRPADAVKLPAVAGEIRFREKEVPRICPITQAPHPAPRPGGPSRLVSP